MNDKQKTQLVSIERKLEQMIVCEKKMIEHINRIVKVLDLALKK